MLSRRVLVDGEVSVSEICCDAGPSDPAVVEEHDAWSVSYVQRGSFGCRCGGVDREMVPGSVLIGRPGEGFECSHRHHGHGDTCLAVFLTPGFVDELTQGRGWQATTLPPLAELMVRGAVMHGAATRATDISLDEAALSLVSCFVELCGRVGRRAMPRSTAQSRRLRSIGTVDRSPPRTAAEPGAHGHRSGDDALPLPAPVRCSCRCHAASIPGALPRAACSAAACVAARTPDHRHCTGKRIRRSVELRTHLSSRFGCVTRSIPGNAGVACANHRDTGCNDILARSRPSLEFGLG
jgi:hypothetical protein